MRGSRSFKTADSSAYASDGPRRRRRCRRWSGPCGAMGLDVVVNLLRILVLVKPVRDLQTFGASSWNFEPAQSRMTPTRRRGADRNLPSPFHSVANGCNCPAMDRAGGQFSESLAAVRSVFANPNLRRIELAFAGSAIGQLRVLGGDRDLCLSPRRRGRGRHRHGCSTGGRRRRSPRSQPRSRTGSAASG